MKSLLFQVIVIEVIMALRFTDAQSLPCSVDPGGVCPDVVCPGVEVTYMCTLPEVLGSTLWTLPDGHCDSAVISLTQEAGCSNGAGTCGPFEAANQPAGETGPCLVSTLTVTTSHNVSNSLIQCSNDPTGPTGPVLVGNATLLVAGPPSAPTGVSVASCSVDSVTLVWEDTSSVPTSYVLSATPTVENCEPNCTTPTRQFTFTGLQLEQTYMFDVSGINCGNQIGNAASYSVKYSGPDDMSITTVDLEYVYNEAGDLIEIGTMWVPLPLSVGAVSCGLQNNYTVTYESGSGPTPVNVSWCDMSYCMDTFNVTTKGSNYTVYVIGFEAVSPMEVISGRNVFLSVMVDASDLPWNVTCTFLSGYSAGENVVCEMSFRSADASGAGVSTMAGGDGDTVVILINNSSTGGGPPAMTEYRYDVTTSSTTTRAIVRGTFVSGDYAVDCTLQPLGVTAAAPSMECGDEGEAASISNGTFCYTGLMPGSTATFSCDKGYELSGGNGPLVCQNNGMWSGPAPTCVEESGGGLSTGAIIGIVFGMLLLLLVAGAITGLLVWCCCCRDPPKKVVSVESYQGGRAVAMEERKPNMHSQPSGNKETRRQHSSEGSSGAAAPNKPPRDPKARRDMKESGSLSSSPPASTTSPSENLVYADVDHGRGGRGGGGGGRSRPPQQQQQPGVEYSSVTQGQTTEGLTYALIDHDTRNNPKPKPDSRAVQYSALKQ